MLSLTKLFRFVAVPWLTRTCGILINAPNSKVAKLGDRVEFECSTNETTPDSSGLQTYTNAPEEANPLVWIFLSATSSTEEFIYRGGFVPQKLSLKYAIAGETIRGRYNLVINSVDLTFAGTYTCSETSLGDKEPHNSSAE